MLAYDDIVAALEESWVSVALHEHMLMESVSPDKHMRMYRVELFPEHDEPLNFDIMPPWIDLSFHWTAAHQLRSEGCHLETEPIDISWTYMVPVQSVMRHRSDHELVRLFHQALRNALNHLAITDIPEIDEIPVDVRRVYHGDGEQLQVVYMHLVSTKITDLSDQWYSQDTQALSELIYYEMHLASTFVYALADIFTPGGHGGYLHVDSA